MTALSIDLTPRAPTPDERARIRRAASLGGHSVKTVMRVLREAGVLPPPPAKSIGDLDAAFAAVKAGMRIGAASKLFRVGPQRVAAACAAAGVPYAYPSSHEGAGERLVQAVAAMRGGDAGLVATSKKFRVEHKRLAAAVKEAGVSYAAAPGKGAAERMGSAIKTFTGHRMVEHARASGVGPTEFRAALSRVGWTRVGEGRGSRWVPPTASTQTESAS